MKKPRPGALTRPAPPGANGSEEEMERFARQRTARQARDAFETLGRGVLILHVDRVEKTIRSEYNTMETDDGSPSARYIRRLVETYDPSRQAVILYRDAARGADSVTIFEIETRH